MASRIKIFAQKHPFLSLGLTFLFVLLFQSLNIFWGFELLDSGFHLTAFDNIFDAPDSVSYNFMYYLTNVIGGIIMNLFPGIGVFGFRVVGALFIDLSIFLIFFCLRKEIPVIHILLGSILVVVSYFWPYSFNNGILSCFLYVCALLVLYKGLERGNAVLVILSGTIVGINIFSRAPNVLGIGLALLILCRRWIEDREVNFDWESALRFLFGVIIGVVFSLLLIIFLGHFSAFKEVLGVLFLKGTSSSDGHSLWNIIWTQIYFYLTAVVFMALFFSISYFNRKQRDRIWRLLFVAVASFVVFYHVYLNLYLIKGYEPLWALCVAGCVICIMKRNSLSLLASIALFMLIVEILGSGSGNNHGSLPALLAAPIASYTLINRKNFVFVAVACMALFLKVIKQGNHFDFGPLSQKQYFINVAECSMIRTTAERAEVMNKTLPALKRYVHPKDTLLVFGSAPMVNYLTHTRPAGGMCWPGEGFFIKPFESAPKILIHKFDNGFSEPVRQTRGIPTGNQMIDSYMQDHQYKIVWENPYFILLFPQK